MAIVRAYLTPESTEENPTPRPTHYREAWWDEVTHEFVVHHGKVGEPGSNTTEKDVTAEDAEDLLDAFALSNTEDGYQVIPEDDMAQLTVSFKLKGETPKTIEESLIDKLQEQITRVLAWRGLGSVEEITLVPGAAEFRVATVHPRKATEMIPVGVKNAGVQTSRVTVTQA